MGFGLLAGRAGRASSKMPFCTLRSSEQCKGAPCDLGKIASGEIVYGCCGDDCLDLPLKDLTSCRANRGCFDAGLTANNACCPTSDGTMLACCDPDVSKDCRLDAHANGAKCRYRVEGELFLGVCSDGLCGPDVPPKAK